MYRVAANRLPVIQRVRDDLRQYGRVHLSLRWRRANTLFVPILGMHRSGTSAVAALLQGNGLYVGADLIDANPDNPRGFFESREALSINEDFLLRLGIGESSAPAMCVPQFPRALFRRAARFLLDLSRGRTVVGWKDPRTTVTWPAWYELLRGNHYQAVAVFRHPSRVAASLVKRLDATLTWPEAIQAWVGYNRRLLAMDEDIIWVNFDAPLESQLGYACSLLGLNFDAASLSLFVDGLVHNREDDFPTDNTEAGYLYRWLVAKWEAQRLAAQWSET